MFIVTILALLGITGYDISTDSTGIIQIKGINLVSMYKIFEEADSRGMKIKVDGDKALRVYRKTRTSYNVYFITAN
jgi:hypothetical protein